MTLGSARFFEFVLHFRVFSGGPFVYRLILTVRVVVSVQFDVSGGEHVFHTLYHYEVDRARI